MVVQVRRHSSTDAPSEVWPHATKSSGPPSDLRQAAGPSDLVLALDVRTCGCSRAQEKRNTADRVQTVWEVS